MAASTTTDAAVFAVPVLDQWLVYAPLNEVAGLVNGAALRKLSGAQTLDGKLGDLAESLRSNGAAPRRRQGVARPIFLGLIPSRLCNLHCVYCNFGVGGEAPKDRMDPAMAVEAVDWIGRHAVETGDDTLAIHFFGGEPFVEWDIVEIVTHRARAVAASLGLKVHLEASSNGVYPEERARFIADHFQAIVLSFDGFPEVHDRHRPHADGKGSFPEVARTAKIFSDSQLELCLRICVTEQNVDDLPEIVRWFCTDFRPAYIDFETIYETDLSTKAGLKPPDPLRFSRSYLQAREVANQFGVVANYAADLQQRPRNSFCPVGQDAVILTPDLRVSTCYLLEPDWQARGLDMNLGRLEPGRGLQLNQEALDRARNLPLPPKCHRCFARWSCAGGCKVNHSHPGCTDELDDFCQQTRLIMATTLLEKMGQSALAARMLDDEAAAMALAKQPTDVLTTMEMRA